MKSATQSQSRKKLPYKKPTITRVRLDPDGTVLTCVKTLHSAPCVNIPGGGNKS